MFMTLRIFTLLIALCTAAEAAATPLSPHDKEGFVSSGAAACIANGQKSQVASIDWPVYCNCVMGKMAEDITKEDVLAIFVASDTDRKAVATAMSSKWMRAHQSDVRACLKDSL